MATHATARLQPVEDTAASAQDVLIHVRYRPDGDIFSIGEKPSIVSASQWLKHLFDTASPHYQTLAGGRGFFRIPTDRFATLMKQLPT